MEPHLSFLGPVAQAPTLPIAGNPLALLRMNGGDLSALRTSIDGYNPFGNAVLFEEEWEQIDDAVIPAFEEVLTIRADLVAAGLTHPLRNIGVTASTFRRRSNVGPAHQSMSGIASGENVRVDFSEGQVPIPITYLDFYIEGRELIASQTMGEPLDVSNAEEAGRSVAEKLEDQILNGADVVTAAGTAYGLRTDPNRNTYTIPTAWDAVTSNEEIVDDVLAMMQVARNDNRRGPFFLYVPSNWALTLEEDLKANSDKTVRQRLMEIEGLGGVKVADRLPNSEPVLVQMTRDTIDLAQAQALDTVEWSSQGGFVQHQKVFVAEAPRTKTDYDGQSGIVHATL